MHDEEQQKASMQELLKPRTTIWENLVLGQRVDA